jgi:hypothetical protein
MIQMINDDDDNKPQKKIQIFNNKNGTYNRKDFVDDKLVNEEFIDRRSIKPNDEGLKFYNSRHDDHQPPAGKIRQKKPQKIQDVPKASDSNILDMIRNRSRITEEESNPLRDFIAGKLRTLPEGWQETALGSMAYDQGYAEGREDGEKYMVEAYENTLDTIRHILELERKRTF